MTTAPQRHPSRSARPTEYQLPSGGRSGVYISGSGHYDDAEDLERSTNYMRDEGGDSPLLRPAQGRLFDADKHETEQRMSLGAQRFHADSPRAEEIRDRALETSRIPTSHLQERRSATHSQGLGLPETVLTTENRDRPWGGSGAAGWYSGPSIRSNLSGDAPDTIAVDPASTGAGGTSTTFIHEQGHREHLGTRTAGDELTHPRGLRADPLKEGVADAYVDRYGGPENHQVRQMAEGEAEGTGKFKSYQWTGYSTNYSGSFGDWRPEDKALYAATRAHASETGEQPTYEPRGRHVMEEPGVAVRHGGNPTMDATMHSLLSTSPHAAQALRQTGLKDTGQEMFRRHRDRQLLTQGQSVQESLFSEIRGARTGVHMGYTPNFDATSVVSLHDHVEAFSDHMDRLEAEHGDIAWPTPMSTNQFGEKPRTYADVNETLGTHRTHAKRMGFTPT